MMWRQAHFGAVMSGLLQLSRTNVSTTGVEEEVSDPVEVWKFHLDDIKGPVHTTQKVTLLPFSIASVMQIPVSKDTACGSMYSQN